MRKIGLIALAATALVALACSSGGTSTSTSSGSGAKAASNAKLGQPARDGKFEFTAQAVKCGVPSVGTSMLGAKAQGQFCLVTLKVTNIGKEAQSFSDSSQKAIGSDKAQYSADSNAGLYANGDNNVLFNQINPGNSVTGTIVFDIPAAAKLASLELHDSPFSGGITVQLG